MTRIHVHAADEGGCGHYRLIWPAEAAIAAGADVELIRPDDARAQIECVSSIEALALSGKKVPHRLRHVPDADVVVLQRPLTDDLVVVVELLKAAGIAVVVELDDDFAAIERNNSAWADVQPHLSPARNYRHLLRACELADLVTVSTPALAARYGRHGRVVVIPNHVPRRYLYITPAVHDELRVGWSGSTETHPNDLQAAGAGIARALGDRRFHVIGDGVGVRRNLGLGRNVAHTSGWLSLEQYPHGMAELDVGVVPLASTPFNEAKSWLKGLEFAAVGVPFVATPTQQYRELHELGAGRLAARPRDWERELRRLIDSPAARDDLAADGRDVAARLTIEANVDRWVDAWTSAVLNRAPRRHNILL